VTNVVGGSIDKAKVVTRWGCVGIVDDGGESFLGRWVNGWYVAHKIYMYNNALVVQLVEHSFVVWLC